MIEVFSAPLRLYADRGFSTNNIRLGNILSRENFWKCLIRLEVDTAVSATLLVTYTIRAGDGTYLLGSTSSITQPGRYEFAFSRSDMDDNSTLRVELVLTGSMRMGATVYFLERGEDIIEWL